MNGDYEEADPLIDFEFKHPMGEAPKPVTLSWWCKWCNAHWPREPHADYIAAYATHVKDAHPTEAWWLQNCGCTIS